MAILYFIDDSPILKNNVLSNPNGTSYRPVRGIIRSGAEHWMRFIARAGMQIGSNSA